MAAASGEPMPRKLWEHKNPENTQMARFMRSCNAKRKLNMRAFEDLNSWSIGDRREEFWADLWEYARLIHEGRYEQVMEPDVRMDRLPKWFKGVRLNFAENLLYLASPNSTSESDTKGKVWLSFFFQIILYWVCWIC